MVAKRAKAPAGCYWRGDTLWGRVRKGGRDLRWSLETNDPKVAAERIQADKAEYIAVQHGDAKLYVDAVVEDWGAHWLQRNKAAKTAKRYLCSIGQLAPFLENKRVSEIDGKLVADIIRGRSRAGVTNSTIKRDLVALSSVMNYAIRQGWLEVNPILPRMKLLEERRDPIVLPTKRDVDLVIERSPGMIADLIRAAISTGARQDELLTARREYVDRQQLTVTGKRNKRRTIDLEPFGGNDHIEALPEYPGSPWLFWHSAGERTLQANSRRSQPNGGLGCGQ
jgi:integrase/recombinase XerD